MEIEMEMEREREREREMEMEMEETGNMWWKRGMNGALRVGEPARKRGTNAEDVERRKERDLLWRTQTRLNGGAWLGGHCARGDHMQRGGLIRGTSDAPAGRGASIPRGAG
jgi:hypothetical protein